MGFFDKKNDAEYYRKKAEELERQNAKKIIDYSQEFEKFRKKSEDDIKKIVGEKTDYTKALETFRQFYASKHFKKEGKVPFLRRMMDIWKKPDYFLARMHLRNEDMITLMVDAKKPYFIHEEGAYIIDENCMRWNKSAKMYEAKYHQDISMPYEQTVKASKIKHDLDEYMKNAAPVEEKNIQEQINPYVFYKTLKGELIQQTQQGAGLASQLAYIKTMTTIAVMGIGIIIIGILAQLRK